MLKLKSFMAVLFLFMIALLISTSTAFATDDTSTTSTTNTLTTANAAEGSPEVELTSTEINTAATKVNTFVENNNRLPSYVYVGNQQVTMPQFLKLMVQNTININSGTPTSITLNIVNNPSSAIETVETGTITKTEYINLANDINTYINTNQKAPNTINSSLGKINFENMVYSFCKILNFQELNDRLPNYLTVNAWKGSSYTTGSTVTSPEGTTIRFTSKQINTAASKVNTFVEKNKKLPNYVYVGSYQVTMPQFLRLIVKNLIYIKNGANIPITLTTIEDQSNADETVKKSGSISKNEYMAIAKRINTYINTYNKAPGRTYSSLGLMRFQNMVYTYSKILTFKAEKGRLPASVWIKPWVYRPVYIISDIINNVDYDNNRINLIVNELKKLGVNAYNSGVKTDNIGIFASLPSNALLVQICGGACASTIYETGTTYYKNLVGSREVFFVWTEGAMKITGLDWLPRAHDDDFSPPEFTGLAHPDEYLLSHGYQYFEGYTNDEAAELALLIYKEARN